MSDFTTWCATIPLTEESEWRLQKAQFGDGYEQRCLDGINALARKFSALYDYRTQDEINAMTAYLRAQKARALPFKYLPTGETLRVFADAWSVEWKLVRSADAGVKRWGSLSVEFRLANGVTA